MSLVDWAFRQDLPTAEKLVLIYLAHQANSVGVGAMDRARLVVATNYKTRSIQRLLKSLRDSGYLAEVGSWYIVNNHADMPGLAELPVPPVPPVPPDMSAAVPVVDIMEVAEAMAQAIADMVGNRIDALELSMGSELKRMQAFHVEPFVDRPEPEPEPPDPVIENPLYQDLIDMGQTEARAYFLSKMDLELVDDEPEPTATPAVLDVESVSEYEDSAQGRFLRVADILDDGRHTPHAWTLWQRLEELENAYTVAGETPAFELLYPAIVEAARAHAHRMGLEEFLDTAKVKDGRAPWDQEQNPVDKEDPALAAEVAAMLAELQQMNDPRAHVQPRTREKGEDGIERTETLLGFHRRVSARLSQMRTLKEMGGME